VFGCDHAAQVESLADPRVLALSLPCSAMLAPAFVDYALREGADSVVVAACRPVGCEFRLGQRWIDERLHGRREPHLRPSVPAARWRTVWADRGEEARLREALEVQA
jgi:coenzyme F420-reducing hydrogenase delta subunit